MTRGHCSQAPGTPHHGHTEQWRQREDNGTCPLQDWDKAEESQVRVQSVVGVQNNPHSKLKVILRASDLTTMLRTVYVYVRVYWHLRIVHKLHVASVSTRHSKIHTSCIVLSECPHPLVAW